MKKIKTMVYINADYKKRALALRSIAHKSMSSLVDEGLEAVFMKYTNTPKTIKEAVASTYGASNTIEFTRDEFNKDFEKREKKRGK